MFKIPDDQITVVEALAERLRATDCLQCFMAMTFGYTRISSNLKIDIKVSNNIISVSAAATVKGLVLDFDGNDGEIASW
jgi:hypothetical protein